jgi:hypothetical protein
MDSMFKVTNSFCNFYLFFLKFLYLLLPSYPLIFPPLHFLNTHFCFFSGAPREPRAFNSRAPNGGGGGYSRNDYGGGGGGGAYGGQQMGGGGGRGRNDPMLGGMSDYDPEEEARKDAFQFGTDRFSDDLAGPGNGMEGDME